jgi:hypothetical protein
MPLSVPRALQLQATSSSSIYVPFPKLVLKVFHVGDGLEVFKSEKTATQEATLQLRHPIVQTQNIELMLTTGAGHCATATRNEHGDFILERQTIELQTYTTPDGTVEVHPVQVVLGTYVDGKGIRQAGSGEFNALHVLKASVAGKPLEVAGEIYVPTETALKTTVKLSLESLETPAHRELSQKWLQANPSTVQTLLNRTVSKQDVKAKLTTQRLARLQTMSDMMKGEWGNVSAPVNLNELITMTDTSGWMDIADVTQMCGMTEAFGKIPGVIRKNAMVTAQCALYASAQVCASYEPMGPLGEQTITTRKLIDFLKQCTSPAVGAQALQARLELYGNLNRQAENFLTGPHVSGHMYAMDEGFTVLGSNIGFKEGNAEKMDLALGQNCMHYDYTEKMFTRISAEIARLNTERTVFEGMVGIENQAKLLAKNEEGLGSMHKAMAQLKTELSGYNQDCEDGTLWFSSVMGTLKSNPDETYDMVKAHIGVGLLRFSNMFPAGTGSVEELHRLVQSSLGLMSAALKQQSMGANGSTFAYEPCFGLASAPSMKVSGAAPKPTVTREQCKSFGEWIGVMFEGETLAGHAYPGLVETRPMHANADGSTLQVKRMELTNMCESTVSNVRPLRKSSVVAAPVRLANKHVQMSMGGLSHGLSDMPHELASEAIGEATKLKLNADLGHLLRFTQMMDIRKGGPFYKMFVHFGTGQSVTGELAVEDKTSRLTAMMTADALRSPSSNASFCNSAIAWDDNPSTKVTSSVVISVPLAPEEQRRITQIAQELGPVHSMSPKQLAFVMEDMGYEVNVGFEGGMFVGMDYTGELDSDTRVSHAFAVHTTPLANSMREWWEPHVDVTALIRSKVQAVLPGTCVRVQAISSNLRVMQLVFDMQKPAL